MVRNIANYTNFSSNSGGGGINSSGGGTFSVVQNSLIARNQAAFGAFGPDCYTNIASGGNNLLTSYDGCTGLIGSDDEIGNPKIGALKRNGGPTKTVALKRGSPAIGQAGNDAPNRDQRGAQARPQSRRRRLRALAGRRPSAVARRSRSGSTP